jgi:hypothetical protein
MPFRRRAALVVIVTMAAVAACGGRGALLGAEYEYEEDLTLSLDGSATLVVNASIPALIALRSLPLSPDPKIRADQLDAKVRELYETAYCHVVRISKWTRYGRRFVGISLSVPEIRALSKAPPFAWARYDLRADSDQVIFRETLGPSMFKPGTLTNVGWTGGEIAAFRLHLPSRIRWHNSRNLDSDTPRDPSRGNILTWEQRLTDRLDGKPIAWSEDHTPGVMEVRMDNQSILYRTLWLFGLAFLAAVVVLVLLIWLTMRKGRGSDEGTTTTGL